jgi:hypothetical protein
VCSATSLKQQLLRMTSRHRNSSSSSSKSCAISSSSGCVSLLIRRSFLSVACHRWCAVSMVVQLTLWHHCVCYCCHACRKLGGFGLDFFV